MVPLPTITGPESFREFGQGSTNPSGPSGFVKNCEYHHRVWFDCLMRKPLIALLAVVLLKPLPRAAENWPQWRGPSLNGVSAEKNLPVRWSQTENVAWKLPLPAWSGSTPIVWGDRIFLNVAERSRRYLYLWCVDRTNGTVRLAAAARRRQPSGAQAEHVDAVAGDRRHRVWVMTGTGILKAFDFDGNELWARDIQKDYGRFGLNWGYGSSPLLYEDSLFVQVLHGMRTDDPSYLLRIDKATGKTVWRVERPTQRAHRIAGRLHDAGAAALRRHHGDRGHRRRRRHRPRSGDREGAVARRRPQSRQRRQLPHRRVAGRARRPDLSRRRASGRCWR